MKNVPVFVNNRNRLSTLLQLVAWLESVGTQEIFIIDNASTYEPLLDYYRRSAHPVIRLPENFGYLALWESGIHDYFRDEYYIYTDSDIVPSEECPDDYLDVFFDGLQRNRTLGKVGFSLRINDLPDDYSLKAEVLRHEAKFWEKRLGERFYDAPIDTTFALYRPRARGGAWVPSARTAPPYTARHLPWYISSHSPPEEELFYRAHATSDSTWAVR